MMKSKDVNESKDVNKKMSKNIRVLLQLPVIPFLIAFQLKRKTIKIIVLLQSN